MSAPLVTSYSLTELPMEFAIKSALPYTAKPLAAVATTVNSATGVPVATLYALTLIFL